MDRSTALLLLVLGMGFMLFLSIKGSTLFYINTEQDIVINNANMQNINTGSIVTTGSKNVAAVILYYDYQTNEALYLKNILRQIGYVTNTISANTQLGQSLLREYSSENHGYTTLPLVKIGHYYFCVSMTYLPYDECPGTIENVSVGGIYVPLCVYNGVYLLTMSTARELYKACITTSDPSCYG
ncbi:MAG: hypothetical protein ACP5GJ_02665 [Nanopusillaceae archaeon]